MASQDLSYKGSCHCGNIEIEIKTQRPVEETPTRQCGCSFCRSKNALYATNPDDRVTFKALRTDILQRYRFGHKTADFLICRECGSFMGAFMESDDESDLWGYAVPNLINLENWSQFPKPQAGPMNYENEDATERLERRKQRWSRARVVFA